MRPAVLRSEVDFLYLNVTLECSGSFRPNLSARAYTPPPPTHRREGGVIVRFSLTWSFTVFGKFLYRNVIADCFVRLRQGAHTNSRPAYGVGGALAILRSRPAVLPFSA